MKKRSKRYQKAKERVDGGRAYPLDEALRLVKETATTKFNSSVEIHVRLGVNPKKAEETVRGIAVLPHGTGTTIRIIAFVPSEKEKEAEGAGADLVGNEEMITKIRQTKKCDFDLAIADPSVMKNLSSIAKILGQRGLMPNPKTETVTPQIGREIEAWRKGKVVFRSDDSGNLHGMIGKASFDLEKLKENFTIFFDAVKKAKPAELKGTYIRSVTIVNSMGPGIRIKI